MNPYEEYVKQLRSHGLSPRTPTAAEKEADLLFDELNRLYWRGRIPKYRVKRGYAGNRGKRQAECFHFSGIILLDEQIKSKRLLRHLLLHEMCHIGPQMRDAHGPRWLRKVARLVRLGETDLQEDLAQYATPLFRKLNAYLAAGRRDLWRKAIDNGPPRKNVPALDVKCPRVSVT